MAWTGPHPLDLRNHTEWISDFGRDELTQYSLLICRPCRHDVVEFHPGNNLSEETQKANEQ